MPQCDFESKWLDHNRITPGGHVILQSREYKSSKETQSKNQKDYFDKNSVIVSINLHGVQNFRCAFCQKFFYRDSDFKLKKITKDQMRYIEGSIIEISRNTKKSKYVKISELLKRFTPEEKVFLMNITRSNRSPDGRYFIICKNCGRTKNSKNKPKLIPDTDVNEIDFSDLDEIHNPKYEPDEWFMNHVNKF